MQGKKVGCSKNGSQKGRFLENDLNLITVRERGVKKGLKGRSYYGERPRNDNRLGGRGKPKSSFIGNVGKKPRCQESGGGKQSP